MCSPRSLRLSLGLPPSEVRPPVEGVSPSCSDFVFFLALLPTPRQFAKKQSPNKVRHVPPPQFGKIETGFQAIRYHEMYTPEVPSRRSKDESELCDAELLRGKLWFFSPDDLLSPLLRGKLWVFPLTIFYPHYERVNYGFFPLTIFYPHY